MTALKWTITIQERNALVETHLGCIWWTINKNRRLISAAGLDDEDVFQQLAIRMTRAVENYDPDKGKDLEQHIFAQLQYEVLNCKDAAKLYGIKGAPYGARDLTVSYSWLDGADSDNILPPDSFLGRAGMDGEGDTVHIHDVAVVVTNQENSGITVEVGNGSFVTTAQMVAYSAPIVHGHAASDVLESTGESVESAQRRQDFDISAIQEQLDTGFAGTAVTHTFAAAQLDQWKGYDGTGLPEGILDTTQNRLYL